VAKTPYLAVARFAKPHGLQGEVVVYVLTDAPEAVFVPGRRVTPIDDEGSPNGPELTIERARPYHRRWLIKFVEMADRSAADGWRDRLVAVGAEEVAPPRDHELYVHEVPGCAVVVGKDEVGRATDLLDSPAGPVLVVDRDGREVLVPFRAPILVGIDRARRRITLDPPPGLMDE